MNAHFLWQLPASSLSCDKKQSQTPVVPEDTAMIDLYCRSYLHQLVDEVKAQSQCKTQHTGYPVAKPAQNVQGWICKKSKIRKVEQSFIDLVLQKSDIHITQN